MKIQTTVIDAGGRYGLHPTWKSFTGELDYYLFEPDFEECERLKSKYLSRSEEISVLNTALDKSDGVLEIDFFNNRAMSSSSTRNQVSSLFKGERFAEVQVSEKIRVESRSIDSFATEKMLEVDFLKLDIEGSEFDILIGAQTQICENVVGIRLEVSFDHIFVGKPLFGAISDHLLSNDFFLLNLDYNGRGDYQNEFVNTDKKYGILTASDAVFLKRKNCFFDMDSIGSVAQAIRTLKTAAFCFENGAEDVGLDLLLDARRHYDADFSQVCESKLYKFVDNSVHRHFYSLKWQPGQILQRHADCYELIFDKPLKKMNAFMESIELNPD